MVNSYPNLSMYTLGTTTMIAINNRKLAKRILTKQWATRKRPPALVANYPIAFDLLHGREWQERRKQFHEKITTQITNSDIQDLINETMKTIDINQKWYPRKTMITFMFTLFFKVLFGIDGKSDTMQEKRKKDKFQQIVPLYIKRHALQMLTSLFSKKLGLFVMKSTGYGLTNRLIMTEMINEWQIKHNKQEIAMENIYDMVVTFFAGTDTSAVTMDACIVYLAKYPKLQQEIYTNIVTYKGNDISPLLLAFIYEVLRIMPAVPMGLPRFIENDVWIDVDDENGNKIKYRIPKESMIHLNIVGINYNENEFYDAKKFDIYRWLKKGDNDNEWIFNKAENNNNLASFAFGKRDCVGKNLAKKILQIVMTELIKKFEFSLDDSDNVDIKFSMDLTYHIDPQIPVMVKSRE